MTREPSPAPASDASREVLGDTSREVKAEKAPALVAHECSKCLCVVLGFVARCPGCKKTSTMFAKPGAIPTKIKPRARFSGLGAKKDEHASDQEDMSLAEAMEEPEKYRQSRIVTWEAFDYVTDGGPIEKESILLLGDRGCGKSTLCHHICEGFARRNEEGIALYCSAEQEIDALIAASMTIGTKATERIRFLPLPNKSPSRVLEIADKRKPKLLVYDSLQAYSGDLLDSFTKLRSWAQRNRAVLILMTHMNKVGLPVGYQKIQQDVDGIFEIARDATAWRLLECKEKHRGCSESLAAELKMGEGVFEIVRLFDTAAPPPPPPKPARGGHARL